MQTDSPPSGAPLAAPTAARPKTHPLVITAALAIIALSCVGIGTLLYERAPATGTSSAPVAAGGAAGSGGAGGSVGSDGSVTAGTSSPMAAAPGAVGTASPGAPVAGEVGAQAPGTLLSDGSILAPIEDNAGAVAAPGAPDAVPPPAPCAACATVIALHEIKVEGEGTGLGAVGGGVVGGVVGNSLGGGRGRGVLTVLGAVGGALAGHAIEKDARSKIDYELVVRYEDGHTRHFKRAQPWPYSVGEPVRIVKGEVTPRRG